MGLFSIHCFSDKYSPDSCFEDLFSRTNIVWYLCSLKNIVWYLRSLANTKVGLVKWRTRQGKKQHRGFYFRLRLTKAQWFCKSSSIQCFIHPIVWIVLVWSETQLRKNDRPFSNRTSSKLCWVWVLFLWSQSKVMSGGWVWVGCGLPGGRVDFDSNVGGWWLVLSPFCASHPDRGFKKAKKI